MWLCSRTRAWLGQGGDRRGVAMDTCGSNLLHLLKNLHTQPPSWPIGRNPSDFLYISGEYSWGCLIAATSFHIQFQVVLKDTRIWRVCVGHSYATSFIVIPLSCLVGVQGAKKVARMASQRNFTPICAGRSFRDVVVDGKGANGGDIPEREVPGVHAAAVLGPHLHLDSLASKLAVTHAWPNGVEGKENVQPINVGGFHVVKPKRKYTRKEKSGVARQGPASVSRDFACGEGAGSTLADVFAPSSSKPKRKYTRSKKLMSDASPVAQLCSGTMADHTRGQGSMKTSSNRSDLGGVESLISRVDRSSRRIIPPITRAGLNHPWCVSVLLCDLQWGGEVLPVPCPSAYGTVLGEEEGADGVDLLRVDFGTHLGIQTVSRSVCEQVYPRRALQSPVVGTENEIVAPTEGDSDSARSWDPALTDLGSDDGSFSSGASSVDMQEDDPMALLGELGFYTLGPEPQRLDLQQKYSDSNWHARTWSLLPRHAFKGRTPGASEHLPTDILLQPVDYFLLFWDETLQRKMVRESNDYADYVDPTTGKRKGGESSTSLITLEEFRQFTGICCLMGVRPQPSIRDYWRRGNGALYCSDVATTMSRWRFEYILRCLHMTSRHDFVTDKQSLHYDPIGKCRWILEYIVARFQRFWNLSPYVTVDECMVAYNGRFCAFKQYLPAKPITHGIKIWAMACSMTSYVYKLEVYVGKDNRQPDCGPVGAEVGMAGQVVNRLTKGLEGQWYTVTCDNYFTSPYLFDDLLARGFYAVGTARKHRKGFPTSLGITNDQPRGTLHIRVHKDQKMAAIHWQDTKGVYFLTTATDPMVAGGVLTSRVSGQRIIKIPTSPIQILYLQKMGGVDVGDQNRSYYNTQICTKKWWHRVYFFCQDSAIANAFTIHKETSKRLEVKPLTHKEFQLRVAYSLMGRPYHEGGADRTSTAAYRVPPRPYDRHVCHSPRRTNLRRVCRVCKRRTFWICQECEGARLCTPNCFEFFHNRGTAV